MRCSARRFAGFELVLFFASGVRGFEWRDLHIGFCVSLLTATKVKKAVPPTDRNVCVTSSSRREGKENHDQKVSIRNESFDPKYLMLGNPRQSLFPNEQVLSNSKRTFHPRVIFSIPFALHANFQLKTYPRKLTFHSIVD